MGHDNDGETACEFADAFLDLLGRNGVQGACGFVHEQDFGLNCKGPCNAQTLLLATGKSQGAVVQTILDLVENGCPAQGFFHAAGNEGLVTHAVDAQAVGHVLEDGLREGIGLLENHAHLAAQINNVHGLCHDILSFQGDFTLDATDRNKIVHAVQAAQKRGLATSGRPDECCHGPFREIHAHIVQGFLAAVIHADFLGLHTQVHNILFKVGRSPARIGNFAPCGG